MTSIQGAGARKSRQKDQEEDHESSEEVNFENHNLLKLEETCIPPPLFPDAYKTGE